MKAKNYEGSIRDKRHLYKTAKIKGVREFVALREYDPTEDAYLCRTSINTVWIPAGELENFCF